MTSTGHLSGTGDSGRGAAGRRSHVPRGDPGRARGRAARRRARVSARRGYRSLRRGLRRHERPFEEFGDERVMDTPIAEEGFVGAAIGAAWMGERPVVELQFADFISCPFDPIVTVAAKTHWRSGQRDPARIRAPSGAAFAAARSTPLPRGLVRRPAGPESRLPRDGRGRLRPPSRRDRGRRPRALLRAQGALPHA